MASLGRIKIEMDEEIKETFDRFGEACITR